MKLYREVERPMKWLSVTRMPRSIRFKLFAAFALNLSLMVVLGVFAMLQVGRLNAQTSDLTSQTIPALDIADHITLTIANYRNLQAEHLAKTDLIALAQIESKMYDLEGQMDTYTRKYVALVNTADRAVYQDIQAHWPDFVQYTHNEIIPASRDNNKSRALPVFDQLQPVYEGLVKSSTDLVKINQQQARKVSLAADETYVTSRLLVIGLTGLALLLATLLSFILSSSTVRNIRQLTTATTQIAAGDLEYHVDIRNTDELGQLAIAFNQMTGKLRAAQAEVTQYQRTLEARVVERTADLQHALAELRESMDVREQLNATVQELSSPVVPVARGILVMPLVGMIDTERAGLLLNTLLRAIEQHRARTVIVDVTGVPIVDTQVARVLLQAAAAARLLGTELILVGLRPELAQTIVGLGLNLTDLITRADLQSGVSYAMDRSRQEWRR